jgi:hypothetical protein
VRWGARVAPLGSSDAELPPNQQTALDIVARYRRIGAEPRPATGSDS